MIDDMQEFLQSTAMPPDFSDELRSNIRAEMGRQRLSMSELSRKTGINRGTLWGQINGDAAITVPNLVAIARVLGVPQSSLLPEDTAAAFEASA